jgi:integrase
MAKVNLSDAGLRSLEAPSKGQRAYWDARLPSFGVRVSQGGAKSFVLNRGNTLITLGRFPVLSLSEARTEAKRLLAEFTLGRTQPQSMSYTEAVEAFMAEKLKSRRAKTTYEYQRMLSLLRFSEPVGTITHASVLRQLGKVKSESAYNHYLIALRIFFNWCISRRLRTDNPTLGLAAHKSTPRARVLSDDELKSIWLACSLEPATREDAVGVPQGAPLWNLPRAFATIVKLLILTGARRGEIAQLQSSCVDLENKTIKIPATVTKNGRDHTTPLPSLAASILTPLLGSCGSFLFPARGKTVPFNGWSKSKAALDEASGVTDWTLHDIRRTVATIHQRLGTPVHVVEKLLNHVSGSFAGIVGVYQRHSYMDEMRDAVEKYERWLTGLLAQDGA